MFDSYGKKEKVDLIYSGVCKIQTNIAHLDKMLGPIGFVVCKIIAIKTTFLMQLCDHAPIKQIQID